MNPETSILLLSALTLGVVHTLLGPDHYVPFIALSRARGWSRRRTLWITALCGVGHVLGSVGLGLVGIAAGVTLRRLEIIESQRGEIAGWALTAFGLVYAVWGIQRAIRNRPHTHRHVHLDGTVHEHRHTHGGGHAHVHEGARPGVTPWVLFIVFVLGPCEPLIPLLMYPAAAQSALAVALVALVFAVATVGTMLTVVLAAWQGAALLRVERWGRFSHALAGAFVLACGLAIQFGL